jgi:1-deoxy-D-xylulose-5-phosphate reductoisomerase
MTLQNVCILGATGSIGSSTLKVIALHPGRYKVFAISGYSQLDKLAQLCAAHQPSIVALPKAKHASFISRLQALHNTPIPELVDEIAGLSAIAAHPDVHIVVAAIVGSAGLLSTLAAIKSGKKVLLANKEALVMAGQIMMRSAKAHNALILPVDSEHNAIFQCLPADGQAGVEKIILTASGGPFVQAKHTDALKQVTPEQACKHPNWSMGRKISVDSATLMNKGLELIEACHLFAVPESKVEVLIHPQSIVHSMVAYSDGSVLAQLGNPDMCTPIAHALAWPERINAGVAALDLLGQQLQFMAPNTAVFNSLNLARQAIVAGQYACVLLNAANEVAVEAFLQQRIAFTDITMLVEKTLNAIATHSIDTVDDVLACDLAARQHVQLLLGVN